MQVRPGILASCAILAASLVLLLVHQVSRNTASSVLSEVARHRSKAWHADAHPAAQNKHNSGSIKQADVAKMIKKSVVKSSPEQTIVPGTHISLPIGMHIPSQDTTQRLGTCFAVGTLIEMASGNFRTIESLRPGDLTRGGLVMGVLKRTVASNVRMFDYGGILVRDDHTVFEDGSWKLVNDCRLGKLIDTATRPDLFAGDGAALYDLVTSEHKIYTSGGFLFADHLLVPETVQHKAKVLNLLNRVSMSPAEHNLVSEDAKGSCFAGSTQVIMDDGTSRRIDSLRPGDHIKGGDVRMVRQHELSSTGALYKCGTETLVSGNHFVFEEGKWVLVRRSSCKIAPALATGEGATGYDLFTSSAVIFTADGGVFSDTNELLTEEGEVEALADLNAAHAASCRVANNTSDATAEPGVGACQNMRQLPTLPPVISA